MKKTKTENKNTKAKLKKKQLDKQRKHKKINKKNKQTNVETNEITYRKLYCSVCLSSENKDTAYKTRDCNSAINIMNLFRYYCDKKDRPEK